MENVRLRITSNKANNDFMTELSELCIRYLDDGILGEAEVLFNLELVKAELVDRIRFPEEEGG